MNPRTRYRLNLVASTLRWLPFYASQRLTRRLTRKRPVHLIIAVADHFEPAYMPEAAGPALGLAEQEQRLERWCREYPKFADRARDSDGRPFRHTYFYPAEQFEASIVDRLDDHCASGWGELEVHLHHGVEKPDSSENTRRILAGFRDELARRKCLARWEGDGPPRYAFVHGNWALANSAGGRCCGVDDEIQILADTGCYADFTLPSAPGQGQVSKINALYECDPPLNRRAPHRNGRDLAVSSAPSTFPLMVQGPLGIEMGRRSKPRIENGELSTANPPTLTRLHTWLQVPIVVWGAPNWLFLKLHCHGMDPRDEAAMFGELASRFAGDLIALAAESEDYRVHFVTAREMTNIILAACDGRIGSPGDYRDYRLKQLQ